MTVTAPQFKHRLLYRLAEETRREFAAVGDSELLSLAWGIEKLSVDRINVSNPFYWSRFYFLGRGTVRPTRARFLVWFKDPSQDPRIKPRPPQLPSQIRRLTTEQFKAAQELGQLVIAKSAGPWAGVPAFKAAVARLPLRLKRIVQVDTGRFIRQLASKRDSRKIEARGRIR